jgi:hypothetical protein
VISVCESPDPLHAANTDGKGIPPLIVVEAVINNAAAASRLTAAIFTLLSNIINVYRCYKVFKLSYEFP